MHIAEISLG
jgi:Cation efflux family